MVRVIIAFACVSILYPAPIALAQTRSSGSKAPPAQSGDRRQPGVRVQQVAQTQEPNSAQPEGAARIQLKNDHLNQEIKPLDPQLEELLEHWSRKSEEIKRLEGELLRLVYDSAFEAERQSRGKVFYEKLDKGRIDIEPVPITQQLKQDRAREAAEARAQNRKSGVRLKKNGEPYDLQPDQQELWSCDGQRVYNLDVMKKEAMVAQLPADMQGKNIMDSPLPFLFGMPPEKAKRRFDISFSLPFDPKSGLAYLKILPRLPQDAQSWSQASVILDLKQFLPVAVQLVDPANTTITVYKFRDIKVNKPGFIDFVMLQNPKTRFSPDLRDFTVNTIPGNALVDVNGLPHEEAILHLERQGLKRTKSPEDNAILLKKGPPAARTEDIYKVRSQEPPPGTPLKPGLRVTLELWNDPAAVTKQ